MRYTKHMDGQDSQIDVARKDRPMAYLLGEVGQLTLGDRMWPHEIQEAQDFLERYRSFELPKLSLLRKASARVVLARVQRRVDTSCRFIVDRFCGPRERVGELPHMNQPNYAAQAWLVGKDWIGAREGQAGVELFALGLWRELMKEAMRFTHSADSMEDLLDTLRGDQGDLNSRLPGAVWVWAKTNLDARHDFPGSEMMLDLLLAKGAALDGENQGGDTALVLAGRNMKSVIMARQRLAKQVLDLLLERGCDCERKVDYLPIQAVDYIESHPWRRKVKLDAIVGRAAKEMRREGRARKM